MQNKERNTQLVLYRNVELQDNLDKRGPFEMSENRGTGTKRTALS